MPALFACRYSYGFGRLDRLACCSCPKPVCASGWPGATLEANNRRKMNGQPDIPLSPADLVELRHRYGMLSLPTLQQVYADSLERCRLDSTGRPPRADQVQVLVTAWRVLRRSR